MVLDILGSAIAVPQSNATELFPRKWRTWVITVYLCHPLRLVLVFVLEMQIITKAFIRLGYGIRSRSSRPLTSGCVVPYATARISRAR